MGLNYKLLMNLIIWEYCLTEQEMLTKLLKSKPKKLQRNV